MDDDRLGELARRLAARAAELREANSVKPVLRVVPTGTAKASKSATGMCPITRESHVRLIRSLRRFYRAFGMDLIVQQALLGKHEIEDLSDDELLQLHRDIDRARECLSDGVTFEEAGLLRSVAR